MNRMYKAAFFGLIGIALAVILKDATVCNSQPTAVTIGNEFNLFEMKVFL